MNLPPVVTLVGGWGVQAREFNISLKMNHEMLLLNIFSLSGLDLWRGCEVFFKVYSPRVCCSCPLELHTFERLIFLSSLGIFVSRSNSDWTWGCCLLNEPQRIRSKQWQTERLLLLSNTQTFQVNNSTQQASVASSYLTNTEVNPCLRVSAGVFLSSY